MTNSVQVGDPGSKAGTRERLVSAAMELFHAHGYHATSLATILERAEVKAGSLYYFFKTKEDLLIAVLDRYLELLGPAVMDPAFARTADPIERIFRVLDGYRSMLLETELTTGCPIGNLAIEMVDAGPQVRARIAGNLENWCRSIELCLDAAADRLPPELNRASLSRFVLTVMEGAVLQSRGQRSIAPYDESVGQLRDYFDRLIAGR